MSGELSFTQELRQQGLIVDNVDTDETKTDENITETKEVSENNTQDEFFDEKIMYIGKKPSMNYVLAINSRMMEGVEEVTIKARGKNISKAVDIAEIVTNRFVTDANDNQVRIFTEELPNKFGTQSNVSTIEIVISKK